MTTQAKVKVKATKQTQTQQAEAMAAAIDTALLELGKQLGVYALNSQAYEQAKEKRNSAKQIIDKLIPSLSKAKVELADTRSKTVAGQRSRDILAALPAELSDATKKNYLSALRICIAENRKFSLNPARERVQSEKKEKAATAAPSKPETVSIEQITTDTKTTLKTTALVTITALLKRAEKEGSTEIELILADALEALQGVK